MNKSFLHITVLLTLLMSFLLTSCEKVEYVEPVEVPGKMKSAVDKGDDMGVSRSGDDDLTGDEGDEGGLEDGEITDDNDDEDDTITDDNDDEEDEEGSAGEGIRETPNGTAGAAYPNGDENSLIQFRY